MKKWIIVATPVLLLGVVYIQFRSDRKPRAPKVPVVSSCKELKPEMRRMGDQYGFQFDVFAKDFTVSEGTQDAPPFVHGFDLRPKNSTAVLEISFRDRPMESMTTDPARVFSDHVEKRNIFDDKGQPIGEDYWGYLKSGERWRQVRLFKGGVVAKYGFINGTDAELFDRVIGSACFLSASGS